MDLPTPEGRRLDERYRIERFDEVDEIDEEAVVELWTSAGALATDPARERAKDVALVALERDDGLVGVTTTYLQDNPHLRMTLWSYRTFVAREHRRSDIAFLLLHATRDLFSDRFTSGVDTRGSGMVFEVQNEILKRTRNQAIWKTSRFAFIGEDEVGAHHRVHYFPGALAPMPPGTAD